MLLAPIGLALSGCHAVSPEPQPGEIPRGMLFRISRDPPAYLFGARHAAPDRLRYCLEIPEKLLAGSDMVFCEGMRPRDLEIAMAALQRGPGPENLTGVERGYYDRISRSLTLPEGKKLREVLPVEVYESVLARARSSGVDPAKIENTRRSIAFLALHLPRASASLPLRMDTHLQVRAKDLGKEIRFLDTFEQLLCFEHLSREEEIEFLRSELERPPAADERISDLYEAGDYEEIYRRDGASSSEDTSSPQWKREIWRKSNDARNQQWLETLVPHIGRTRMFIICGTAHLGGKNGLVRLLRSRGYSVDPVCPPWRSE